MHADRTIPNNKQEIIISDNVRVTCMLKDAAISGDRNVIKKAEKILKYKDLLIEIQRMCNVQAKVTPLRNKWGQLEPYKNIQTIPEQHTERARNQRTLKKKPPSHFGNSTRTSESTNKSTRYISRAK